MRAHLIAAAAFAFLAPSACDATCSSSATSSASCVGPYVDDQPPRGTFGADPPVVTAGETVTLHGHFFRSGCDDTGNCVDEERPLPPVTLLVTYPGGGTEELGPLTPAGWDSGFRTELTIPAGTPPGRIRVRYDGEPRPQRPFVLVVSEA